MIYSQSALLLLLVLVASSHQAAASSTTAPAPCSTTHDNHDNHDNCAPGCWNPDNIFVRGQELHCIPSKPGYYSPADSNDEFACPKGHVSSHPQAAECTPCPSGSMAIPDGITCMECPTGSYQDAPAKSICFSCDSSRYRGQGANAVTDNGYCLLVHDDKNDNNEETTTESNDSSSSSTTPTCINTKGTCAAGCWNEDDIRLDNGKRLCVAVEPGYYSPATSNNRLACPKGHVSADEQSEECTPCRPGSVAHINRTGCIPCPRGTYQDAYGGKVCYGCNADMYGGPGANNVSEDGYCLRKKDWKVSEHDTRIEQQLRRRVN